jgi:hypothetical protein
MFRRFMIVCWALFSIAAIASAAGWIVYKVNYDAYRLVLFDGGESATSASGDDTIKEKRRIQARIDANRELIRRVTTGEMTAQSIDTYRENLEELESQIGEAERRQNVLNNGAFAGAIAGAIGLVILLLNVALHTGHWVWMGRESK